MQISLVFAVNEKVFHPLDPNRITIVGRHEDADIRPPDAEKLNAEATNRDELEQTVSRWHAAIAHTTDGWWIKDLGSNNGTSVRSAMVKESKLEEGSVVRFGKATYIFRSHEADDTSID